MSDRKPIRKIEVSIDRKFPTTIEYGRIGVDGNHYILHTESRHWEENFYTFSDPQAALKAYGYAACCLGLGLEVPRTFEDASTTDAKF